MIPINKPTIAINTWICRLNCWKIKAVPILKIKVIKLINRINEIQKMYLAKTMFF